MPWAVGAAVASTLAARHAAHQQRVAVLRAQGRDDEADALDAQYKRNLDAMKQRLAMDDYMRQCSPDHRVAYLDTFRPRIRLNLPTPALLYERPWWPWLVFEMYLQLWITI